MDRDQIFRLKKLIQPAPGPEIKWAVVVGTHSGLPMIRAWVQTNNKENPLGAEEFFDGPPENILAWTFKGQRCPLASDCTLSIAPSPSSKSAG